MTAWTWGGIVWAAIVGPAAVLIGKAIRRMDPAPAVEQSDSQVDLLARVPVDCLSQAEVDALFVRLVAPCEAERQGPTRCRCGHTRNAHEHYRRGSDCALCGCDRFTRTAVAR